MPLRPLELRDVAAALDRELGGAVVQKVWAPWPERLELELRQPGRTTRLRISVDGQGGRVSIIEARTVTAEKPSPWLLPPPTALVGPHRARGPRAAAGAGPAWKPRPLRGGRARSSRRLAAPRRG